MHPVRHISIFELINEFVHHGLNDPRGIGARDVAMQPALGVGDHGHRVLGTAHDEARIFDGLDQGLDLGGIGHHVLQIGAQGEVDEAITKLLANVTKLAQGEKVQDTLSTHLHGPDLVPAISHMTQDARLGVLMVLPHTKVLALHGVHILPGIGTSGFDRLTHVGCCHRLSSKNAVRS